VRSLQVMAPSLALLASPLLGASIWQPVARVLTHRGWHTVTCAATAPARTGRDALGAFLGTLPTEQDLVLVPHSNAGAYVPELAMHRRVVAAVFVDAVLPPRQGQVPLAPPQFLDLLREKADDDGALPVWTHWWDESEVAALFPDAQTRELVETEQQQLPLSYFEGTLPVQQGWDKRPGAYLAFGDTYATERAEAARRRWPVSTLQSRHLHMLTDPDAVASALVALISRLGFDVPNS
jgi:hypothetical protein